MIDRSFTFYGGVREFVNYLDGEAIVHGPAETGKTMGALHKLHLCAREYPNASIVITRKTLASTFGSVLQMFTKKVLPVYEEPGQDVTPYGGEKPEWYDYANGSRIWITGMDKSGKVLSSEHDIIYVNQAEDLTLEDWETLTTRTTGRAGNMPYSQTIGDANPSYPLHWMYQRPTLRVFYSKHTENPALYDPATGQITEQGRRTMTVLEALTGTRRTRLLDGKPAQAEGVIYDTWDDAVNLIYENQLPEPEIIREYVGPATTVKRRYPRYVAGQDWGYTHPGVLGVWGLTGDGDMYLVAQVYHTRRTVDWWTERAVELHKEFGIEVFACGPDQPAYIQAYRLAGLNAIPADNAVLPGINAVQQRLKPNNPRLFVVRDSLRYPDEELIRAKQPHKTEDEFPGYVWADSKTKEIPVKEKDDAMDMTRYATLYIDRPQGKLFTVLR